MGVSRGHMGDPDFTLCWVTRQYPLHPHYSIQLLAQIFTEWEELADRTWVSLQLRLYPFLNPGANRKWPNYEFCFGFVTWARLGAGLLENHFFITIYDGFNVSTEFFIHHFAEILSWSITHYTRNVPCSGPFTTLGILKYRKK